MTSPLPFEIQQAELTDPISTQLISALNAELDGIYPEAGANHFRLDAQDVTAGNGIFLVAFANQEPAGCGAIRRLDETAAEVKRMYVVPAFRGRGVAKQILAALERAALELGCTRLVLEAGNRQTDAMRLYESAGFAVIPPFGEYVDSPLSVCMAKDLR